MSRVASVGSRSRHHRKSKQDGAAQIARAGASVFENLEPRCLLSTVPTAPQNVTVSNAGQTHSERIAWNAVSGATVYSIRLLDPVAGWLVVGNVNSPTTSFVVTGLAESSTNTFAVIAKNSKGNSPRSASVSGKTASFKLYDDTNYTYGLDPNNSALAAAGAIELSRSGVDQYQQFLYGGSGAVNIAVAQEKAQEAAGMVAGIHYGQARDVVIDFEPAEADVAANTGAANQSISKMLLIIDTMRGVWAQSSNPAVRALRVGVYGVPLMTDSTAAVKLADNTYLLTHPITVNGKSEKLVDDINFFTVCSYTGTTDVAAYAATMPAYLAAFTAYATTYNKPIYSYIWPNYFEQTDSVDPINSPIDGNYWKLILDISREYTDGAVIWSGSNLFDANAQWWSATQDFLAEKSGTAPAAPTNVTVSAANVVAWYNTTAGADLVYIARSPSGAGNFSVVGAAVNGEGSWSDTSAVVGKSYDYQVWSANAWGASSVVTVNAHSVSALNAFAIVNAGNTVNRNDHNKGGYWSDATGLGLYGMYATCWAHYTLQFSTAATQFAFQGDSVFAAGTANPLALWIDPVMVNNEPTMGAGTHMILFTIRKTGDTFTNIHDFWQSFDLDSAVSAGKHQVYIASPNNSMSTGNLLQFQFGSDTSMGPAQPRELHVSSQGSLIHMQWTDWANNESGYVVQASTDGVNFTDVALIAANDSRYVDKTGSTYTYNWAPPTGAKYTLQVRAVHGGNPGAKNGTYVTASARSNQETGSATPREGIIQAESYDWPTLSWQNAHSATATPNGNQTASQDVLVGTSDGQIVRYEGVDFGSGATSFNISLGTYLHFTGNNIEIWIDGQQLDRYGNVFNDGGVKVGTLTTTVTGGWDTYATLSTSIAMPNGAPVSGVHDVFLKFVDPTHDNGMSIAHIDWFSVGANAATGTDGGSGDKSGSTVSAGGRVLQSIHPSSTSFSTQPLSTSTVVDLIDAPTSRTLV